jgi:hypothetical protein
MSDKYSDLLILQYKNKPKAVALIDGLYDILYANGLILDVQDGFNIDTAVGKQLDILGKYIGVDRSYYGLTEPEGVFFAFANQLLDDTFNYKGFQNSLVNGKFVDLVDFGSINFLLNDDQYRFILKLKIIQNTSNHSEWDIQNAMNYFFNNDVIMTSGSEMEMTYFIKNINTSLAIIAYKKNVLPKPMGVKINSVIVNNSSFFAFSNSLTDDSELFKGFQNTLVDGSFLDTKNILINNN